MSAGVLCLLDKTLVDAHLVLVPGLGTLTARSLTGGDVQGLGGQTDGALDLEGLGAGTVDQLGADLLEGGDLARGEGDADLVDLLLTGKIVLVMRCAIGGCLAETVDGRLRYPDEWNATYGALAELLLRLLVRHLGDCAVG
jgi:hypothetical protein